MANSNELVEPFVLIRGGGDLASGVAIRLHRCGFLVGVAELPEPLTVRRLVSFSEAVYRGVCQIEEVTGTLAVTIQDAVGILYKHQVAVMVDPECTSFNSLRPLAVIDARMLKNDPGNDLVDQPMLIGLGPGFLAGKNCHAVIETNRGPHLGRVFWQGGAQEDTRLPEQVAGYRGERVLRAPADGVLQAEVMLGQILDEGDLVAWVAGQPVRAPFKGVLRGLVHDGLEVSVGMKIGDIDPRLDPRLVYQVSDKALSIGGGVLEALLSDPAIRSQLGRTHAAG
ncbi:MAG TPA: selenium-dependent molybdenum cofactor biosynthesis protein YqeB [Anaerolineaceae bacterium]|nr:selenium-dependent molybdenum cofactor biosynthesis protein YqeB [Anaerolineaceae bacterium]